MLRRPTQWRVATDPGGERDTSWPQHAPSLADSVAALLLDEEVVERAEQEDRVERLVLEPKVASVALVNLDRDTCRRGSLLREREKAGRDVDDRYVVAAAG